MPRKLTCSVYDSYPKAYDYGTITHYSLQILADVSRKNTPMPNRFSVPRVVTGE